MIAVLVCDSNDRERELIRADCKMQAAKSSDERLQIMDVMDDKELLCTVKDEQLVHLLYYSFRKGQTLEDLRTFRRQYGNARLMLITDPSVSPLEYLRPGIAPDSLILRPLSTQKLSQVNSEFMGSFFERFAEKKMESNFVVDTRDEKVLIPYSQIYYFEARNKKLFVRTRNEEYAFYDTIDSLEEQLPEMFRRCHRSYIVNMQKVKRILTAEGFIDLGNQIGAPISRSYKAVFKGVRV